MPRRKLVSTRNRIPETSGNSANTSTTVAPAAPEVKPPASTPQPTMQISEGLRAALGSMSSSEKESWLYHLCRTIPGVNEELERELVIRGKDIIRYRVEDESYSDQDSLFSETESNLDDKEERGLRRMAVAVESQESTPRWSDCVNCGKKFDLTHNKARDCRWHSGEQVVNEEKYQGKRDVWYLLGKDDKDFVKWECCDRDIDDDGCKRTRHKS